MRWGHAEWWWLAALPLVALAAFAYGHFTRRHLRQLVGDHPLVARLLDTLDMEKRLFKQLLVMLALILVTAAALRPQYGRRPEALRKTGIDVVIAFDISKSMLARDVQPSRIAAARGQLAEVLALLSSDRVALVPFAGIAFTQSPLTADQGAVRMYLENLDPTAMPVGGTNLAMAIERSLALLTSDEDRGDRSSRGRVILLITDGEDVGADQGEAAKAAARKAAEQGIKLFAVAVGTRLGEPIPLVDGNGDHAGYQKDSSGKIIYSKLDMALLEDLTRLADPEAPEGSQRVLHFDGSAPVAGALADQLDTLQKTALEGSLRHKHGEKYQYALLPALLLLLIELLVGERRRHRRTR